MLKRQTIDNFKGIGSGKLDGEFFYSENLKPGQFGLEASLYLAAHSVAGGQDRFNWMVEFLGAPWGVDLGGDIYKEASGTWTLAHANVNASDGNGFVVDQKGRLLFAQDRWLGMTTDGTSFSDNWKDLIDTITDFRPMDIYEDWVAIGNGNKVKVLNTTDDSVADGLTLPSGFTVRCIKSNRTGILIGANAGNRGVLILWKPGYTRSLNEWIWLDAPMQSIAKAGDIWVVTTTQEQYLTDGYSLTRKLPPLPDTLIVLQPYTVGPSGTLYSDGKILTANTDVFGRYNRHKTGLWILDLATDLYQFVSAINGQTVDMTWGALFKSSTSRIIGSYSSTLPAEKKVVELKDDIAPRAVLIAGPFGSGPTKKTAQNASIGLSTLSSVSVVQAGKSFKVAAKIYNFKRTLWGYGTTNAVSATAITLKVDGTSAGFNNAKVGDEVTILSGANAGQARHIASIAGEGTSTEVWTMDIAFSTTTESGAILQVMPFKLIASKTVTSTTLDELEDIFFDIKNKIKGKRYLLKFVISDISSFPLNIDHVSLDYDDQETTA